MEPYEKKNGLGIVSLILGIVGFLTGFILIGIFLDIISIILGIIAIVSKKHKSGLGIAGLVIASIGLLLMILIGFIFSGTSSDDNSIEITSSTAENREEDSEKESDNKDVITSSDLDITEYDYENTIGDTLHFLIIKNNSPKTVEIHSNCTALDSSGTVIGADSSDLNALGSGCESILVDYFDSVSGIDKYEYTLDVKEDTYYDSVIQDVEVKTSVQDDKVIITCTNNGAESAEYVEAYALFFENGVLIDYGSTYIVDDDSELKVGATISEQIEIYGKSFDDVKIYITGRK